MIYWKYLKYVLRHKWYVLVECAKMGELWRGITHDLSKFRPDEFIPYARFFYGNYPSLKSINGDERNAFLGAGCLYQEKVQADFDLAWLKHIHRNPHHWQYWILREDSGTSKLLDTPLEYKREMLADWKGAGKAINGYDDTVNWYLKNRERMVLSSLTKAYIERKLGIREEDANE